MPRLDWSPRFARDFKRLVRRNPQLRALIEQTLEHLTEDPFHPTLKTHKLKGDLAGFGLARLIMTTGFCLNLLRTLNQKNQQFIC